MALRRAVLTVAAPSNIPRKIFVRTRAAQTATEAKEQDAKPKQTHFGFQTVEEEEKWKKVHEVFETVAEKYDVMNDAMSFGIHRVWKDIFMQRLAPTHGTNLLDVAGGTGDITFRYLNYLRSRGPAPGRRSAVTVCDINQAMLDVGRQRAEKLGYTSVQSSAEGHAEGGARGSTQGGGGGAQGGGGGKQGGGGGREGGAHVSWLCADAERLPLPADTFSAYTIAFGIRNCTHVQKVLEEAYRVLTPGGRFMCLEFSHLPNQQLQWAYDQYSFQVIPVLGQLIAGQWRPYQYLVESIRQFPNQEKFKSMIEDAGFRQVTYENLTFGVCAIHSGFKI